MNFLQSLLFAVTGLVLFSCADVTEEKSGFTKQVEVFGVYIYATEKTSDDKILHAANVLAQYLDNDEDGIPDNPLIVENMIRKGSSITMGYTQEELRSADRNTLPPGPRGGSV